MDARHGPVLSRNETVRKLRFDHLQCGMSFIEGCDRRQPVLIPGVLDDYVGKENPDRFMKGFVGSLDLEATSFLRAVPPETGRETTRGHPLLSHPRGSPTLTPNPQCRR